MSFIMILLLLSILWLGLFLYVKKHQNINMLAGFLFFLFLCCFVGFLLVLGMTYAYDFVYIIVVGILIFAFLILIFGVYILIAFLIVNTIIILRKEKFRLAHILTLLLAITIIALIFISILLLKSEQSLLVIALWSGTVLLIMFLTFHIFIFLETLVLNNIFHPQKNLDYIIVLGSGLINGVAPPLLTKRIDAAIKFARKQEKKNNKLPYLLMSGGQGNDEPIPESVAMKRYAIEQGYQGELIITEEKSRNTLENMQFSKVIMEQKSSEQTYHCAYATSSYHLLRAGFYAKEVALYIRGIGAKTSFYYLPNAVLREYIAYIIMHKRLYIIVCGSIFIFGTFLFLILYFLGF